MADKEEDSQKFHDKKKKTLRNKLAGAFLAAAIVLPSGWYGVDRFVMTNGNFQEAVTQGDYETAETYAAHLGRDARKAAYIYAAQQGDSKLFNMLLQGDDEYRYDSAIYEGDKGIVRAILVGGNVAIYEAYKQDDRSQSFYISSEDLAVAARHGQTEMVLKLLKEEGRYISVYLDGIVEGALVNGHTQTAIEALKFAAEKNELSSTKLVSYLNDLSKDGDVEDIIAIGESLNQKSAAVFVVLQRFAVQGEVDDLLDIALTHGLNSQGSVDALHALMLGSKHFDAADKFSDRIDVNLDVSLRASIEGAVWKNDLSLYQQLDDRYTISNDIRAKGLSYALKKQNVEMSAYMLNQMIKAFSPEEVERLFDPKMAGESRQRFLYELALRADIPDAAKPGVAEMFTGTLDDALRQHWGIGKGQPQTETPVPPPSRLIMP